MRIVDLTFRVLLLLTLALLLPRAGFASSATVLDPADGPHVDLKLSLDPDALRMQATMNLVFLDEIVDFTRESPDRIAPVEGLALLDALQAWGDADLVALVDAVADLAAADEIFASFIVVE